jgi:murein L,D-transpeptidase YcbB/YkuD
MKTPLNRRQRMKKVGFFMLTLILIVVLQGTASYGTQTNKGIASIQAEDTSINALIRQYLYNSSDKTLVLNYPNTLKRFYEALNGEAAWTGTQKNCQLAQQAFLLLYYASEYGLSRDDFHPREIFYQSPGEALVSRNISNNQKAKFDILLSDAMVTFMNYLHYGKLNPEYYADKIDDGLELPFYTENTLLNARAQNNFRDAVLSVQPKSKQYEALQDRMCVLQGFKDRNAYTSDVKGIAINMERLRWAEINEDSYIQVNIPSYNLKFIQPDSTYEFRAIVGKPSAPTPSLNSQISYFTTFPEWRIPQSIFTKELLPKALRDTLYLDYNHYTIYDNRGKYIRPTIVNLRKIKDNPELFYVRQSAGCDNALGNLVFRFKNNYDIYLHDTPEQQLFKKEARAFSHSCIRVENAGHLAELILKFSGDENKLNLLNRAYQLHLTKNISLKKPVPIKITYLTCEMKNGMLITYADVYNLDAPLEMAFFGAMQVLTVR